MDRFIRPALVLAFGAALAQPLAAQDFATSDPVLERIWEEGMTRSQVYPLAQALLDSIGPRLTGAPGLEAANDWLVSRYAEWGVEAEKERYGTWKGWEPGITHVDLVAPRISTLDASTLGWSPGTDGPVEGAVTTLPAPEADVEAWAASVAGAFVLVGPAEPSCRPLDQWEEFADEATYQAFIERREEARAEWAVRAGRLAQTEAELMAYLAELGAAGAFTSNWPGGYGVRRVFGDRDGRFPVLGLACEDFAMLHRLAEHDQGPRVRVDAGARDLGEVPVHNTIATLPGTERPDEYVLLSAHLDSWHGGQGATDNGTGTVVMAEAMRLLARFYPNPKRTIVAGHWGGEEQGLNGSRAYAADHPEVVAGLQALFNQDNGTGRISNVSMQGLLDAGPHFVRWLAAIPSELTGELEIDIPGTPGGGGSDYAAFTCAGAPAFGLWSESWDYGTYTWHTNLDTLDKVVFENVRANAVLIAMLAYMASEDPELVDRERRAVLPVSRRTGEPGTWPDCRQPDRDWSGYGR